MALNLCLYITDYSIHAVYEIYIKIYLNLLISEESVNFTNFVFLVFLDYPNNKMQFNHGLTHGLACWICSQMVPGSNPGKGEFIACSCIMITINIRIIYFLLGKNFLCNYRFCGT
jgi:hypothetical protein